MTTAERLARLPAGKRRRVDPLLDALLVELLRDPEIERLAPHLAGRGDEELRGLEARNLVRALERWRELEVESLAGWELRSSLGVSRETLRQMRADGRLLGVRIPGRREYRYPRWQFDGRGRPRAVLPELVAAAREAGLEPLDVHMAVTGVGAGVEDPLPAGVFHRAVDQAAEGRGAGAEAAALAAAGDAERLLDGRPLAEDLDQAAGRERALALLRAGAEGW